MSYESFGEFFYSHMYLFTFPIGVLALVGAVLNWNWLCNPSGAPSSYSRTGRRLRFFLIGACLIVISITQLLYI